MAGQTPPHALIKPADLAAISDGITFLDRAYKDYYERSDGYGKSQEGAVSITFGNYFDRKQGRYTLDIEVYSYVFATGRREDFTSGAAFREWAEAVLAEQLATRYDEHGDVIYTSDSTPAVHHR